MRVVMTSLLWLSNFLSLPIGHILDENAGDEVAELASGEQVDGDACLSGPVVSLGDRYSALL